MKFSPAALIVPVMLLHAPPCGAVEHDASRRHGDVAARQREFGIRPPLRRTRPISISASTTRCLAPRRRRAPSVRHSTAAASSPLDLAPQAHRHRRPAIRLWRHRACPIAAASHRRPPPASRPPLPRHPPVIGIVERGRCDRDRHQYRFEFDVHRAVVERDGIARYRHARHRGARYDALGTTALSSSTTASGGTQDQQITTVTPTARPARAPLGPWPAAAGGSASDVGGGMSDPAQSLSVSAPNAAQTLGGTTSVPAGSAPCPSSAPGVMGAMP